jgi:hypothetical protein
MDAVGINMMLNIADRVAGKWERKPVVKTTVNTNSMPSNPSAMVLKNPSNAMVFR